MSLVTDERLMAYADGELPPDEARALEIMMSEDPTLAARLAPFKATRTPLANTFNVVLAAPVPDRLISVIKAHPNARARLKHGSAGTAEVGRRLLDWFTAPSTGSAARRPGVRLAYALGSSAAVVLAVAAVWTLGQPDATYVVSEAGRLVASKSLADALETKPSQSLAAAAGIAPVLTFRSQDAFCREYRIAPAGAAHFAGVACREAASNTWRIAKHVEIEPAKPASGDVHTTASGKSTASLDAFIDTMIQGDALGPEDESNLIENAWKSLP